MSRRCVRAMPRLSLLACALATAATPALAQNVGSSTRFTPVLGDASTLYPRSPASVDAAPEVVAARPGALDYSRNGGVDRVRVEVDRDGVPADGQTPVHVRVQLLDGQGRPLSGTAYATIEHSGGRVVHRGRPDRSPSHEDEDDRRARGRDREDEVLLHPGEAERRHVAALAGRAVLGQPRPLAHHHDGHVARRRRRERHPPALRARRHARHTL